MAQFNRHSADMGGPSPTALAFQPDPEKRYKLIYLARRNPALAPAEFPEAWRSHAALAGKFATSLGKHFLSSHQCVKDREEGVSALLTKDYDGSTILGMKSWEDLLAARYHPHSLEELYEDEKRVFAGAVDNWTMAVEESVIVDGDATSHVLLSFVSPEKRDGFDLASRAAAGRLPAAFPDAKRIVWNEVVDPAKAYRFAAVIEVWFPNRDKALAAASNDKALENLGQATLASATESVQMLAKLNLARQTTGSDGATEWTQTSD
ncbi:EthD domain-containing protein [Erythrobacter litoralis]|uniref:EthD domain-containing protein n=1 Tax=Erythrobacter litoralis TaxID=39960 RepID=UPI0024360B8B|nr:EthD domain-containing protein [Erythrobacter litoralis]